ncbi:hypothetical protein [Nostoc sp. FACHB-110]|uniref:hypothetical protein n=1 Tax=Nostoc sp. FACHB-110 TaxID=2692834 RepID=UPI001688726D|nr:hypothetical protein [Nostoc sp. FACHB-110]MBD2437400.1 hypothetical protein [Nostoc sp. FACHB-110]
MDLEKLIDNAYGKYQAELKAEEEAKLAEEKKLIDKSISVFKANFDQVISSELQQALGIEIIGSKTQSVHARFGYMGYYFKITKYDEIRWRVDKGKSNFAAECLFAECSNNLINRLLIALGEIKASVEPQHSSIPIEEQIKNIQDTLDRCYADIKAISESQSWKQLCEKSGDPEMKTHLGDARNYLSEAMDCVDRLCIEDMEKHS